MELGDQYETVYNMKSKTHMSWSLKKPPPSKAELYGKFDCGQENIKDKGNRVNETSKLILIECVMQWPLIFYQCLHQ